MIKKHNIQFALRDCDWHIHMVMDANFVRRTTEIGCLENMRKLNFGLCKDLLPRRFAEFELDERFHWVAVFQGSHDALNRHGHFLLHVPTAINVEQPLQRIRLNAAIGKYWAGLRWGNGSLLPWYRYVEDLADNNAVATYVSRDLTRQAWEKDVYFSH